MRPRAAGRRLLRGLSVLAVLGIGCEALVDGELGSVRCADKDEGLLGPPSCPEGAVCEGGTCVAKRALGAPCVEDGDCRPLDFCLDLSQLDGEGQSVTQPDGERQSVCARPCCSSSDCDPRRDAVCWVPPGGGAGVCRVGRDVHRPEVGTRLAGEACSSPGDCRSGHCSDGVCVDSCCSDTHCAATGMTCQLTTGLISAGSAWACQPPGQGMKGPLEECDVHGDCASGICADLGDLGFRCTIPCCSSEMCPSVRVGDTVYNVGCALLEAGDGATVRACAALRTGGGFASVGVPCGGDDECRSGMCVGGADDGERSCSDVCCSDASCGDASRFGCRPYATGPSLALRCAPK
ncbi:hypothetical protein WMF31_16970 [Sorangium sp. So ce1036]|uniref:hypothetical protein n=1 Tax=Sorangium sp. So ce1036 TaxID=3133328 RepID=UPI003EFF802C